MIQTAKELVAACLDTAKNYKTLYVMGCFGAPMTQSNKNRYLNGYAFNRKPERKAKIDAATAVGLDGRSRAGLRRCPVQEQRRARHGR